MSIFSDVAVALRKDALEALPKNILEWLEATKAQEDLADCSNRDDNDRGRIFILRDMKWDRGHEDVNALYVALEALDEESYLVLEACHEYPETDSMDKGGWVDNPFRLKKYLKAELAWAEV